MNKLSALLGDRTGKRVQYHEIQDATTGGAGDDDDDDEQQQQQPLEYGRTDSSGAFGFVDDWMSFLRRYACLLGCVLVLVVFLALEGERASRRPVVPDDIGQEVHILHRPCQIYRRDVRGVFGWNKEQRRPVKVIQTSLGEPSNQWGQVPCLYYDSSSAPLNFVGSSSNPGAGDAADGGTGSPNDDSAGSSADEQQKQQQQQQQQQQQEDQQSRRRKLFLDQQQTPKEYGIPSAIINVDFASGPAHPKREPILGFGGAFTEATALNYMSLNDDGRKAVMELLFGENGLGYSLGRVHMNSCDFCVASYSFDDTDGDFDLTHFDTEVTHDQSCGMIEMMLRADNVSRTAYGGGGVSSSEGNSGDRYRGGVRIIVSPWSPPPWMKAPTPDDEDGTEHAENMTGSATPSCLREGTGPDSRYAETWALYFSKFITAYKNLGVNLYGVTPQNEPEFPAPWDACAYTAKVEGNFIAHHLGPMLNATHPDVKLLMFDHNKDHAPKWATTILDPANPASDYVDGTAIHWYAGGMDRLLDGAVGSANMHRFVSLLKTMEVKDDHIILGSEACHCPTTGYAGGDLGVAWARAERYAHTILADLAAGSNGWIEWNLLLDSIGGPNHLGNLCDSPLLAVPHRARGGEGINATQGFEKAGHPFGRVVGDAFTRDELNARGNPAEYIDVGVVIQPIYFYMGHISRHVRPGSRAVRALVDSSAEGRTFRRKGEVVAGGGINDNARVGMEVTLWPCEGSTRQSWTLNRKRLQVSGHDWLGKATTSCVGKTADSSFQGLLLGKCGKNAGSFDLVPLPETPGEKVAVNIVLSNENADRSRSCLVVSPLKNNGGAYGPRGGAQVNIGHCSNATAEWYFDESTGEITSDYFSDHGGEVCLTTGWPFLQAGAFETPNANEGKSIILLNEAAEPANFVLQDAKGRAIMSSSIPAHSIQTIAFD